MCLGNGQGKRSGLRNLALKKSRLPKPFLFPSLHLASQGLGRHSLPWRASVWSRVNRQPRKKKRCLPGGKPVPSHSSLPQPSLCSAGQTFRILKPTLRAAAWKKRRHATGHSWFVADLCTFLLPLFLLPLLPLFFTPTGEQTKEK
ncbi:hypothetical protein QOT17_021372 [Balamuthia mandrillaris]